MISDTKNWTVCREQITIVKRGMVWCRINQPLKYQSKFRNRLHEMKLQGQTEIHSFICCCCCYCTIHFTHSIRLPTPSPPPPKSSVPPARHLSIVERKLPRKKANTLFNRNLIEFIMKATNQRTIRCQLELGRTMKQQQGRRNWMRIVENCKMKSQN